jgi:hypothetical protein
VDLFAILNDRESYIGGDLRAPGSLRGGETIHISICFGNPAVTTILCTRKKIASCTVFSQKLHCCSRNAFSSTMFVKLTEQQKSSLKKIPCCRKCAAFTALSASCHLSLSLSLFLSLSLSLYLCATLTVPPAAASARPHALNLRVCVTCHVSKTPGSYFATGQN